MAAQSRDVDKVSKLLAAGANPLFTNQQGKTAMQLALRTAFRTRKVLAAAMQEAGAGS